ncbi:hypothetical protein SY83_11970 [Paenibacillus swuensis]|uniref:Nucleoside 2-deoxyribosyltransferase n=1 Tax=Paenibacillus swuensis TaxID=1178515 RepID=A0A172TJ00_9BACL|nr:hypothetical protein [Paenibacillus swuensis]ANE46874.1 hypothetical protein SY83_11970 [Paenibacillus swuensis]
MNFENKKCFIITPISIEESDIRRAAEGVIDAVIVPLLTDLGFKQENITVSHRLPQTGSINKQVIQRVLEDDLVIANLTSLNANVMYELALRHCVRKPVIQICENNGTNLPFDIIEERTVFYKNDMYGVVELSARICAMIPVALDDIKIDNPVYRVIDSNLFQPSDHVNDADKYIIDKINDLERAILLPSAGKNKNMIQKNVFTLPQAVNNSKYYYVEYSQTENFKMDSFISRLQISLNEMGFSNIIISDLNYYQISEYSIIAVNFVANRTIFIEDINSLVNNIYDEVKIIDLLELPY